MSVYYSLQWWPGNVSIRDMGADAAGIGVALAILTYYDAQLLSYFTFKDVERRGDDAV